MATLGAMPWPESHFEASSYCLQAFEKIHSDHGYHHFAEVSSNSAQSPRPSIREHRSSSDFSDRGLVAISPLLVAATAPGAPPALVPVDEAAAHWSSIGCLMEDPIEPLALSPDAATRHLPKSLIDSDDIDVQGMADDTDHVRTSQKDELHQYGWDLANEFPSSVGEWGLCPFNQSWNGNTEEAWALEVALQNFCWEQSCPETDAASMFWDSLGWEQAGVWNESCAVEKSLVKAEASNTSHWDEAPPEATQEELIDVNAYEEVFETPEKPEPQSSSRRKASRPEEPATKNDEEEDKRKQQICSTDRRAVELKGNETTVMLRNIPNKYTRDMLAKQLSRDHKGSFDFIYLPIDFKNKCNVGYAFVNFRNTELCKEFFESYNGVDVRKCLPGFNSRKVVEVTPARVQGLEENVTRLRSSPVMTQLKDKPEWMPLLFDESGQPETFPEPDLQLPPMRLRGGRLKDVQK